MIYLCTSTVKTLFRQQVQLGVLWKVTNTTNSAVLSPAVHIVTVVIFLCTVDTISEKSSFGVRTQVHWDDTQQSTHQKL